jgi:hypothetical protein
MKLLQWIQSTFPPAVIAAVFPLVLLICFRLTFGGLIHIKGRSVGGIYALSLLTVPFMKQVMNLEWSTAAIIGGLWVPATCGLLLIIGSSLQTLNVPYRPRTARSSRFVSDSLLQNLPVLFRFTRFHFNSRLSSRIAKVTRGFLGAVIGTILGLASGLVISGFILALFGLLGLFPLTPTDTTCEQLIVAVVNSSIYTFSGLGLVLGVAIGLEQLQLQRIHQRILIAAVIYSALVMQFIHKIFQFPSAHQSTIQVMERYDQLTLRCRSYRSTDWVWIGFNGLYNGFVLLISAIALWRGTWITFGLGIILLIAIGSGWTLYSLTRLFNYTIIIINSTTLKRWNAPLCLTFSLRLPLQQINRITASRTDAQSKLSQYFASSRYQVFAVMRNGKSILLLKQLERWEEAVFVKETIERFLNHHF